VDGRATPARSHGLPALGTPRRFGEVALGSGGSGRLAQSLETAGARHGSTEQSRAATPGSRARQGGGVRRRLGTCMEGEGEGEASGEVLAGARTELLCLRGMATGITVPLSQQEEGEKVCTNDEWAP
jgi:hypothetical protein